MSLASPRGIDRQGVDASFAADETLKSNLILEGRLLASQQQPDAAAERFAQAAGIEERLSAVCLARGLKEKGWLHQFSAASCWAQAGNFYEAICQGTRLLQAPDLPPRLVGHFWIGAQNGHLHPAPRIAVRRAVAATPSPASLYVLHRHDEQAGIPWRGWMPLAASTWLSATSPTRANR